MYFNPAGERAAAARAAARREERRAHWPVKARPRARSKKTSEKSMQRAAVPHGRAQWADAWRALGETARHTIGGRGRAMPALALRDQPLDCSMRLREPPAWPPPRAQRHGQCPPAPAAAGARTPVPAACDSLIPFFTSATLGPRAPSPGSDSDSIIVIPSTPRDKS
ncbi:unnamed protein product [Euphydryas editha]|uniref:Uncharacterized protein n=1 Tax=Euphydryas editha TaxID=104508 RepID=A0AAU9VAB7_EUPED|nr:unnamed protein product [Euphydryas editha]